MKLEDKFAIEIKEPILKRIFTQIKKRNYYIDEDDNGRDYAIKIEAVHIIEEFFIRHSNIEYTYTTNHELPHSNPKKKDSDYKRMKYYNLACEYYQVLTGDIDIFFDIHYNNDKYYSTDNNPNTKKNIFLHSKDIVRKEIEYIKELHPKLYEEIIEYLRVFEGEIIDIDSRQRKYSGLLSYIKVLDDSATSFTIESKYGKIFYPIIVDIFLDYAHIMDMLNSYDNVLRNKRKRYKGFRNKLLNGEDEIDPAFYYLIKFSKLERIDNIKRYLLKYYLEKFNNDKNINILFRKLFVSNLKERKDYTPADMKNYEPKIHLIFNILTNSKYFL